MDKAQKLAAAKAAKDAINKEIGEGSVMSLKDTGQQNIEVVSTGSIGLDQALGIGGLPRGRVVEIYGPESSGKTTLATHVIAEAQKSGGLCAYIDAEHAFDKDYATNLGVNVNEVDFSQPDSGDDALEIADKLIQSGAYDVVVIDSVAALVPKAELEGAMGESKMGLHARLMSQALRKLTATVHNTNTLLIFINQLREKIGVMFGSPEVTTGGNALKFYASVRLDVRRSLTTENSVFDENKEKIGNQVTVKIIKNKVAPPFKNAKFDIIYGSGIDQITEIIDQAHTFELLKKWGKTITFMDEKHDIVNFKQYLIDNPELFAELKTKINEKWIASKQQ